MATLPGTTGAPTEERRAVRCCAVTRQRLGKEAMVRLVVGPDGVLVPDIEERLPGRGLWIAAQRGIVERAVTKRLPARALGAEIAVPPDLADRIAALLARRCLELVGLARRAGQAVSGFEKVKAALERGRVALVLQAADGSPDQRAKVMAGPGAITVVALFTAAELAEIFGRDRLAHVAVLRGGIADRLARDCARLAGFRGTQNRSGRD
ncbi:MAG TPA: RNA-binding protein [Alphaproteobacteria bacterium]|nr:RNA-binding protein [Alphaproteobacteria bacterium]